MSIRTWLFGPASILVALAIVAGAVVYFGQEDEKVQAADHRDSITPSSDPYADINDVYVFNDRGGMLAANRVCFVMTVNPHARGLAPTAPFSNSVKYNFHADVNDDAKADKTFTFTFSGSPGSQTFAITGLSNKNTYLTGPVGSTPVTFNAGAAPGFVGSAIVLCDFREDPFFFDLVGFRQFLAGSYNFQGGAAGLRNGGTAVDTFAGQNVAAIIIEMDEATLQAGTDPAFKAWASTTR